MPGFRSRILMAGLAAFSLVAAAPPSPERVQRMSKRMAAQAETGGGAGAAGAGAAGAGAAASGGLLSSTWFLVAAGLASAGALAAVAAGGGNTPVSPAS